LFEYSYLLPDRVLPSWKRKAESGPLNRLRITTSHMLKDSELRPCHHEVRPRAVCAAPSHTMEPRTGRPLRLCKHDVAAAQLTWQSSSASKMYFPSLYFSVASNALSYFQPTVLWHSLHSISRTICRPVVILRSPGSRSSTLTTLSKR
jgi:hypothetical protein